MSTPDTTNLTKKFIEQVESSNPKTKSPSPLEIEIEKEEEEDLFQSFINSEEPCLVHKNDKVAMILKREKEFDVGLMLVNPKEKFKIKRGKYLKMDLLIGKPYNVWFTYNMKDGTLNELKRDPEHYKLQDRMDLDDDDDVGPFENVAKKDIKLKTDGFTSEFSKDKYMRRKSTQVDIFVMIKKPTVRLICDSMKKKASEKHGFIRFDAISAMLFKANVQSYSKIGVFSTINGMVLAAIFERMGGKNGKIFRFYHGNKNKNLKFLNELPKFREIIKKKKQNKIFEKTKKEIDPNYKEKKLLVYEQEDFVVNLPFYYFYPDYKVPKEKQEKRATEVIYNEKYYEFVKNLQLDSFIIADDEYETEEVFSKLFSILKLSGYFVIFSKYKSKLEKIMKIIVNEKKQSSYSCVNVELCDIFTREQQVLENRTHPTMNCYHESGFILSGIKVE